MTKELTINSRDELRQALDSELDLNDIIIAAEQYVGRLCEWGHNLNSLTEPQKNFFLNQIFEMEINNGGISQYFFNSGQYAHHTLDALKAIGASRTAEILQVAINRFPEGIVPYDDAEREDMLENIEDENEDVWEPLEDIFYKYEDDLNALNLKYIRDNIEYF